MVPGNSMFSSGFHRTWTCAMQRSSNTHTRTHTCICVKSTAYSCLQGIWESSKLLVGTFPLADTNTPYYIFACPVEYGGTGVRMAEWTVLSPAMNMISLAPSDTLRPVKDPGQDLPLWTSRSWDGCPSPKLLKAQHQKCQHKLAAVLSVPHHLLWMFTSSTPTTQGRRQKQFGTFSENGKGIGDRLPLATSRAYRRWTCVGRSAQCWVGLPGGLALRTGSHFSGHSQQRFGYTASRCDWQFQDRWPWWRHLPRGRKRSLYIYLISEHWH